MIALAPVLVTVGWVTLLILAPALPALPSALVYGLGSFICHQIPERSFYLGEFQLPVCARCLGIYLGAAAGAVFAWLRWLSRNPILPESPFWSARRLAIAAALPTATTVALEAAGIWSPSNVTRAVAGVPLGALIVLVVVSAVPTLHYDECAPPRPTGPKPPQHTF